VLAGTNGAGKSSVAGAMFRQAGADYFNPDEATARILAANPDISTADANSAAWHQGKRLLERAIAERLDFAFETTLGGHTISALLHEALAAGIEVRMWFVGLSSPELHMARVRSRVARGGHDIPEEKIRERYDRSRINLIELMPRLTELRVFDNSFDADPHAGRRSPADTHSSPCEGEDPAVGRVVQNASMGQGLGGRSAQDLEVITPP
jgi:predicted ABC-type ATPase